LKESERPPAEAV